MIKCSLCVALFTILVLCGFQSQHTASLSAQELTRYDSLFKDLEASLKSERAQLWGKPLYGPILLVDPQNRMIIANEGDASGILSPSGTIYLGILPTEINISNTALNWIGKRWTMLILPLPGDPFERRNLLIHELFHLLQPQIGFSELKNSDNKQLDDLNGRIYLKLELHALEKALQASTSEQSLIHLQNALMFRNYRYVLYPTAAESENQLELNEGLAEYTGSILSERSDLQLREHYIRAIHSFYKNETFVRSFAYVTLPVYGYFMQQTRKTWNRDILMNTELFTYLTRFFNYKTPTNFKAVLKKIQPDYNFDSISEFERTRQQAHLKMLEKYEQIFEKNPTLTLHFIKMNISFDPRNIMPYKNLGTIYPNLRITDEWGILEVKRGALLSPNWDKLTLSQPTIIAESQIEGDGWSLQLNENWTVEKNGSNYTLIRN